MVCASVLQDLGVARSTLEIVFQDRRDILLEEIPRDSQTDIRDLVTDYRIFVDDNGFFFGPFAYIALEIGSSIYVLSPLSFIWKCLDPCLEVFDRGSGDCVDVPFLRLGVIWRRNQRRRNCPWRERIVRPREEE